MAKLFFTFFWVCYSCFAFSQERKTDTITPENPTKDSIVLKNSKSETAVIEDLEKANAPVSNPKYSPIKAGLYSAVLPGFGQYYNKKYWKIPIVWGGIGTGVGITLWNQKRYRKFRDAFVAELNGQPHEFSGRLDKVALGNTQDRFKRQRDYAIAVTGLVYILNIVDAVVDAHLYEGRKDPDLALQPTIIYDEFGNQNSKAGLSLSFKF